MPHIYLFILGVIISLFAFFCIVTNKSNTIIYFSIFIAAFSIRLFVALQDPFLHSYDERYHALVGSNLTEHSLKPTLKNEPILPYDYKDWQSNHIWVHKQPVFLWQIALSISILGNNEIAVRLPSVLMGAILTLLIFRIGSLYHNKRVGFISCILFMFSFFQLEQTAGVIGMDHNDIAFSFYVTLSIWAYLEYKIRGHQKFIYLIALFSAFAVLNKWLPGLVVYGIWLIDILIQNRHSPGLKKLKGITISLILSSIIWGAWQVYILLRWPLESKFTYAFNSRHFTEALELHGGNFWYHFNMYNKQYGNWTIPFLIIGCYYFFVKKKENNIAILYLFIALTTYTVFSIAATKSFAYVFYISPFLFLIIGVGFNYCYEAISKYLKFKLLKIGLLFISLIGMATMSVSFHKLYRSHSLGKSDYINNYRDALSWNASLYKQLDTAAANYDIIFNCRANQHIDAEFYSSKIVYSWYPDSLTIDSLQNAGYKIAAFTSFGKQILPAYIKTNPQILILNMVQKEEDRDE